MINVIDNGMNVQMTTDAARFTHNQNNNTLSLGANLFALVSGVEGERPRRAQHEQRRRRRFRESCSRKIRRMRCRFSIAAR
jgi:hypothetical protein